MQNLSEIGITIKFLAGNILKEQELRLRQGPLQIKEVLQELEIQVTSEEARFLAQLSFKSIIAHFVYEKWKELEITYITPRDIEQALDYLDK